MNRYGHFLVMCLLTVRVLGCTSHFPLADQKEHRGFSGEEDGSERPLTDETAQSSTFQTKPGRERMLRADSIGFEPCGTPRANLRQIIDGRRVERQFLAALALQQEAPTPTLWESIWERIGFGSSGPSSEKDHAELWSPGSVRANISTHYHIIVPSTGSSTTPLPDRVRAQHTVLNEGFSDSGLSFSLTNISYIVNDEWWIGSDDAAMTSTLTVGGTNTLNVFVRNATAFCGYAVLPNFLTLPLLSKVGRDVIVVNEHCFLNSGSSIRRDGGKTVIHEVGHWLGLPHTFDHGCWFPGDGIADTPYEKEAYRNFTNFTDFTCGPRDSCRWKPGIDPSDNYMDYSPDPCTGKFTRGQIRRMEATWSQLRR